MRNERITLTIGIPVYNVANHLESLLDELSKINNSSIEIILIDDGSKDRSLEICEKYKSRIIHVYSQKNMGPSKTRNRIIELSKGKWITFIDSDDMINSEKYCKLLPILDNKTDWYINITRKDLYNKMVSIKNHCSLLSSLIEEEIINSPVAKFYKKDIIKKQKLSFDSSISIGEDLLFNMNYSRKSKKLKLLNEDLYEIKENPGSLTRRFNKNKYDELIKVNNDCQIIYANNKRIINSLIYIRVKNCLSCLRDYKNNRANTEISYARQIIQTNIQRKVFLNNFKTTFVYWVWKIMPKKIIIKLL